jgi:serine/threonine protein phosphatase PrpC
MATIRLNRMSRYFFEANARSAVGLVRNGNEDSALISSQIIAVADGMGGHAGGEVASSTAIKTLASLIPVITDKDIDEESSEDLFINSLYSVDSQIKAVSDEEPALEGLGTTLTALFVQGETVSLLHVGDSRAYRLRGGSLEQISVDHTVVQELISKGAISPSEVSEHPQRSMLTQALMGSGNVEPVLQIFEAKSKDRFLLCSDGLSGVLTEKEIKSLIKGKSRSQAIDALIDATYINGAPDNVTVVIADVSEQSDQGLEKIGAAHS